MIDVDHLYFSWLVSLLEDAPHQWALARLCNLLHHHEFNRRVGNDVNRAVDGQNLRLEFFREYEQLDFSPEVSNYLLAKPCSWLEMMVALARQLDFYYDGGVGLRLIEMLDNMGLGQLLWLPEVEDFDDVDLHADSILVAMTVRRIDESEFDYYGRGGLFPLHFSDHPDQREVEIWEQHAAYFREKLEGVMWTSTN